MNKQSVLFSNFLHTPAKAQLASFKVACRIAKRKKPHTIAEELELPAALDLVSTMIGESVAKKLKLFNFSLQNTDECHMKTVICLDLDALISHFEKYFSEDMEKYNWIRNSFLDKANAPQGFTSLEAEKFISLTSVLTLTSI